MTIDSASARLTVDLDALAANYAALAAEAAGAEVAPVVKADGYGLGASRVAARLHAEGARSFFVARVSEGEALRRALGPGRPGTVYVLDGAPAGSGARLLAAELTPVLSSVEQAHAWAALPAAPQAALHVDTGMNRLGLTPAEAHALAADPGFEVAMVMSHLACAAEPAHPLNARQLAGFAGVRALFPHARASLANSAGIFLGPEYRFDLVRPGVSLYGGGPFERADPRIEAVATLEAPVLQVRSVAAGESVGYGATFVAPGPMRVAVVAAGYADGFLRAGGDGGFAVLHGVRAPIVGRVSMDLIALDVGEVPDVRPGDLVELLGPQAPVDEVAAAAGTLAYEFLVRLGPRAERRWLGER